MVVRVYPKKVAIAVFSMFCSVVVGWVFRVRNVRARCKFRKASLSKSDANHLRITKIKHTVIVICFLVNSGSLIKDLMGDLHVMDIVCELLNRKPGSSKVQYWKHLGRRFKIGQDILDDLSPQQDFEYPTEALIRHLGSREPDLTIEDLCRALREIERADVIAILEDYLPGRTPIKLELSTNLLNLR